jgi:hypothetical protein
MPPTPLQETRASLSVWIELANLVLDYRVRSRQPLPFPWAVGPASAFEPAVLDQFRDELKQKFTERLPQLAELDGPASYTLACKVFEVLSQCAQWKPELGELPLTLGPELGVRVPIPAFIGSDGGVKQPSITPFDKFLAAIIGLDATRMKRCKRRECGRLYFARRTDQKTTCSIACARIFRTDTWRERIAIAGKMRSERKTFKEIARALEVSEKRARGYVSKARELEKKET